MGLYCADDMSEREQAMLYEFTRSTTDYAFRSGYISRRWSPSDAMLTRLRGYYEAGLTPDEAADGLFGTKH